jgi:signal transduction histidine kinase
MFSGSKKFVVIALFTIILIALVNLVWWFNYSRTEQLLEEQLSRRLASIAMAGAIGLKTETVQSLLMGDFEAYAEISRVLENIREADSLSELFILDENYDYLVTTSLETDSTYFLAAINGPYIDSIFFGLAEGVLVTRSYQAGRLYLKSAFAPLYDSAGFPAAVMGVEANVDYFDALEDLKGNLYFSTVLSVIGGILLGTIFLLFQQRINRAEQQLYLGQTQAYLGRMVAVVAHEVKNPLMIVRASGERLVKKTGAEEAGFIVEEIDRLDEIVSGYLDFARGEKSLLAGETPGEFDLTELLRGIARQIGEKYAPDPIKWDEFKVPESMALSGYRRSLRQVVFNLLTNGADACLAVSKPISLGLSAVEKAGRIRIAIKDTGGGMDKKEQARVFTPFYTTKQTGSGLGLYLSKKLVEEMGGKMLIESDVGAGTEVVIELPEAVRN